MFEVSSKTWEKRDIARVPVEIEAWLFQDGLGEAFSIKNISSYGALLEGGYVPNVGSIVELATDQIEVEAEVRWRREGACGLLFRRRIVLLDLLGS
jgi:hypothetical protein